jgi:hypothetical protein
MTNPLSALTLHQPWATAIVDGPKRIENRSWSPPARLLGGGFIAIHAGKTFDPEALEWIVEDELWAQAPRRRAEYPAGAIVGVAEVIGVADIERDPTHAAALDPWACGPRCWLLGRVWGLAEPVPSRGAQGLWPVDDDVAALVRSRAVLRADGGG